MDTKLEIIEALKELETFNTLKNKFQNVIMYK